MLNKIIIFFALIALLPTVTSYSAFEDFTSGGTRALGMGGAFTGVCEDASAITVNPAGVENLSRPELTASFSSLYPGLTDKTIIYRSRLGFVFPKISAMSVYLFSAGINWRHFAVSSLYSEEAGGISISREINETFSLGILAKYLYWKSANVLDAESGALLEEGKSFGGFSFDAGMFFKSPFNANFGLVLTDLNQPDIVGKGTITASEKLPIGIRFGCSFKYSPFTWALDAEVKGKDVNLSSGVECWFLDNALGIRAGTNSRNVYQGLNLASGFSYRFLKEYSLQLDYAFVYPINTIKGTYGNHEVDVSYRF